MRRRVLVLAIAAALALGAARGTAAPAPDEASERAAQLVYQLADDVAGPAAADALYDLGASAVPALVGALGDASVRDRVIDLIARLGPVAKDAVPALVAIVQDAASPSRRNAVHALGSIGADAAPAYAPLAILVGDAKAKCQADAADALGRIAADAARRATPRSVMSAGVERAIDGGLDWLDRHQAADGRWSSKEFTKLCTMKPACSGPAGEDHDAGVTGLALLAHLGAGHTPLRGARRSVVKSGLASLLAHQRADGLLGDETSGRAMYQHGCAALALAEAYRTSGAALYEEPLRRAVAFIEASRNPEFGWRYDLKPPGDNDTSVTAWMTRTLASASEAGIPASPAAIHGAVTWVELLTEPELGRTGYQQRGGPSARFNETVETHPASFSEALTAAGMLIRFAAGRTAENDEFIGKGAALLVANLPRWNPHGGTVDLYYWMHASEALRRVGGRPRQIWCAALAEALLQGQAAADRGCAKGSWDPVDPWSGVGGRVYSTSMALIALTNWVDDPPEKKPPLPPALRTATWALEKALKSPDEAVRRAAQRALDAIRGGYASK